MNDAGRECRGCLRENVATAPFCVGCGTPLGKDEARDFLGPRLTMLGAYANDPFELQSITTIGHSRDNVVSLTEKFASSEHCVVTYRVDGWYLYDHGSRNGTYLNEVRITHGTLLREGDVIRVGTTALRFETTRVSRPPPVIHGVYAADSSGPFFNPVAMYAVPPGPQAPRPTKRSATPVRVSSVVPEIVAPGLEFLIDIAVHLPSYRLDPAPGLVVEHDQATIALRSGASLIVHLVLDSRQAASFRVDEPEAQVTWNPPCSRTSFRLSVADDAPLGVSYLRAEVGTISTTLCHFYVQVVVEAVAAAPPRMRYTPVRALPRSAFASYSSADRAAVCQRIESLQALGVDVFLDCLDIQQGAHWEDSLAEAVVSKDAFLLFWSTKASESKYVTLEWRTALAARGIDYIVPNALVSAEVCPPPPALEALHFGSRFAFARHGGGAGG